MMIRTEMYIEMLAWYDDSVWAIGPDVYMLLVGCNVCYAQKCQTSISIILKRFASGLLSLGRLTPQF